MRASFYDTHIIFVVSPSSSLVFCVRSVALVFGLSLWEFDSLSDPVVDWKVIQIKRSDVTGQNRNPAPFNKGLLVHSAPYTSFR